MYPDLTVPWPASRACPAPADGLSPVFERWSAFIEFRDKGQGPSAARLVPARCEAEGHEEHS
jgi:hypothetical protein